MSKSHLLIVLAALCSVFCPLQVRAATLSFEGVIQGFKMPPNDSLSTLDFYFISALSETQITASQMFVSGPAGLNTTLAMHFYQGPDNEGDVHPFGGVFGNNTSSFTLPAGDYFVSLSPGNSDFDGFWPLPAFANNDTEFDFFDYQATVTGDVRLNEIWRGRQDGTFDVTIVPEPGISLFAVFGYWCAAVRVREVRNA